MGPQTVPVIPQMTPVAVIPVDTQIQMVHRCGCGIAAKVDVLFGVLDIFLFKFCRSGTSNVFG